MFSTLNSKTTFSSVGINPSEGVIEYTNVKNITVLKYGRIVQVIINIKGKVPNNNSEPIHLFDLPEGYAPTKLILINYVMQTGETLLLEINNTGRVLLYNIALKEINDFFCRQNVVFISEE